MSFDIPRVEPTTLGKDHYCVQGRNRKRNTFNNFMHYKSNVSLLLLLIIRLSFVVPQKFASRLLSLPSLAWAAHDNALTE